MYKKIRFHTQIFKKNLPTVGGGKTPSHTLPPLGHFAPLLLPPLTNPACTTVTGNAKRHKGPCSPLIGVKEMFKGGNILGLVHIYATSHNYPLILSFSVEENAVFIHKFSKNLPTVGVRHPPPTPSPPRSIRSLRLGRFAPSHITAPPPLIKSKSWLRHCN